MHLGTGEFESSSGLSGLGFDDGSPCKPEGPRLRGTLKSATVSPQAVACYAMSPVAQRHPLACPCPAAGPSDGYHVSHWVCKLQLIFKSKAFPKPRSFGEILSCRRSNMDRKMKMKIPSFSVSTLSCSVAYILQFPQGLASSKHSQPQHIQICLVFVVLVRGWRSRSISAPLESTWWMYLFLRPIWIQSSDWALWTPTGDRGLHCRQCKRPFSLFGGSPNERQVLF